MVGAGVRNSGDLNARRPAWSSTQAFWHSIGGDVPGSAAHVADHALVQAQDVALGVGEPPGLWT